MRTFKEQLADDLGAIFNPDEFGDDATYIPKDTGVGVGITVLVEYGSGDGSSGTDELNTDATCLIRKSSVEMVQEGDSLRIGADEWIIDFAKVIDDGLVWKGWMSRVTR